MHVANVSFACARRHNLAERVLRLLMIELDMSEEEARRELMEEIYKRVYQD
jgi:hypothetical protein